MTAQAPAELTGTVVSFDAHAGLGSVADSSGRTYPFHCVAIADGSRSIQPGAPVRFSLLAKLGRLEAWRIDPNV